MELREANKSFSVIPIILRHATWEQDTIGKLSLFLKTDARLVRGKIEIKPLSTW